MKIIRYGVLAVLGAFLLPAPPENVFQVSDTGQKIDLETGQVIAAAASTYSDVTGFCERQPGVCQTAGQVFAGLEAKVKYNFQRVYEWSRDTPPTERPRKPLQIEHLPPLPKIIKPGKSAMYGDPIITGSIALVIAEAGRSSDNTLEIEDLVPEWRGPVGTATG